MITSAQSKTEVIDYIENNKGKLTMCIIFCEKSEEHMQSKSDFPDTVFDVIDHPTKLALSLNSCHSKIYSDKVKDGPKRPVPKKKGKYDIDF